MMWSPDWSAMPQTPTPKAVVPIRSKLADGRGYDGFDRGSISQSRLVGHAKGVHTCDTECTGGLA